MIAEFSSPSLPQPLHSSTAITGPRQIFGDRSANNEFQKAKIFVIQFPKQIGLIRPQRGVGRQEAHDDCVVVDVAYRTMAQAKIGLAHRGHAPGMLIDWFRSNLA
jgi:hypothetical protein